jgi:hypothetical protein
MSFRRYVATGAIAAAFAMCSVLPANAQGGGGGGGFGGGPPPFTPEPGAKDLKSVLYNWVWHVGMLRGQAENELIGTLDWHGEGTVQIDGQSCTTTKLRVQANYQIPGYRTQIECRRANGQTYSNVETLNGTFAWDEDRPGAEIVPGEGKATARANARDERMIRLWANPHGAAKAAIAAAAGVTPPEAFVINPATLLDRQATAGVKGNTTLAWEGNKAVLTFPLPYVTGATATATLDETFLMTHIEVKHGSNIYEWTYGDYQDFNNELHRIEALWPATIVERRNGTVVRDFKTTLTEIGQVYVQMPVPASVRNASGRR